MRKDIKILLIDDAENDSRFLIDLLVSNGYSTPILINDKNSFNNLSKIEEQIDVVISEQEMWGVNSLHILNIVREKWKNVIFVLISDKITEEFGVELLKEGVDIYFLKPYLTKLPPVIEKLYDGRAIQKKIEHLSELNEKLEDAYREIEIKNQNMTQSLLFAKRIQDLTLPKLDILLKNFPEAFILHRPKDIVSGDFYWFYGGNGHGEFMAAVGDCTGHGVSGALLSMIGYNLLNDIVGDDNLLTNPTDILSELDLGICKLLKQDTEPGYQDGIDMSFVTINKKEKKIYFCGCKRPLLYLVRNEKKISVYKGEPYLVGGTDTRHEKTFKTQEIDYLEGDIIYMSTDGYTDQFGGDRNRKFMKDKFSDMLLDIQHLNLCYQSQLLEQKIIKWQGDLEQTDDILVLGIKL